MRRYGDTIMLYAEVEVSVSDVMDQLSSQELLDELLERKDLAVDNTVKLRKLIVALLGLPSWYYSDKARMVEEIGKLF